MLISLLLILYGLTLCYLTGNYAWALLQKGFKIENPLKLHPAIFPVIGMAVISPLIGIYHFFFKIDFVLHLFLIALVCTPYKTTYELLKQAWQEIRKHSLLYAMLFLGSLLSVISRPGTGDIADYHLQAIKWAEAYPNILGLGNFNRPLANNNWWFNLQAFFGFSWLGVKSVYVCNAIYFMCLFAWFYFSDPISKAHQWMRLVFAAFIILSLKTAFVGSVTSDFIVTLMIYLLLDFFVIGSNQKHNRSAYLLLSVLFICWIVTVKTTAIVFFMIPLLWVLQIIKEKNYIYLSKLILLGLVFMIPWLIGNVMVCGYLLYPFNQIDLFQVDWKVPASYFEYDKVVLSSWAKVPGQDVFLTQKMLMGEWLPMWFERLDLFNKTLIIGFVVASPLLWLFSIKRKDLIWPVLFIQLGFAIIFINGPHPRFLFGYMVSSIAFVAYVICSKISFELPQKILVYAGILLTANLFYKETVSGDLLNSILQPKPYPQGNFESKNINGFEAFITKDAGTCWDKYPASYYFIDSVELRGKDVTSGFCVKR